MLYAHKLINGLVSFLFLSFNVNGSPIFISGSKCERFERDSKAVRVELISFFEANVYVFDLKFKVIDDFFA